MLSKNKISFINSLKTKKYREKEGLFIAEGSKLVLDLLESRYRIKEIYAVEEWVKSHPGYFNKETDMQNQIDEADMKRITALSTPSPVFAIVEIPMVKEVAIDPARELILVLDEMRDPGNLGTIIRIADWFGISTLVCSEGSVDLYNPKVVQSTMGSIARVNVQYQDLQDFLTKLPADIPIYGTFLNGEGIYSAKLSSFGVIIIGSEANGISEGVAQKVTDRLFIPSFHGTGEEDGHPESLNASVATAIVCSEFRRRYYQ